MGGTEVHILTEVQVSEREAVLSKIGPLQNIVVVHHFGRRTSCSNLLQLPLEKADAVLGVAQPFQGDQHNGEIASDSDCLLCTAMISGICDGDCEGIPPQKFRGKIICEVLGKHSDRILRQNPTLQSRCTFFGAREYEMSMLALAAIMPACFQACRQLLLGRMFGDDHCQIEKVMCLLCADICGETTGISPSLAEAEAQGFDDTSKQT